MPVEEKIGLHLESVIDMRKKMVGCQEGDK